MYREILESIDGISIWPIIGLALFVPFFILMLIRVFRHDKKHDEYMRNMPLEK